ncbi:MAG: Rne/Rng family ribonuclease, partial [Burkholderiales bacterium]
SKAQRRGNVYKGVITRVEPSLEACFVDYGTEKQGFLPFKEIDPSYLPESSRYRDFSKLTEGTELIVQVEKDERGNKGAALTTYISLPGRYLVLMPNNARSGGISRRIDGEERDELKAVLSSLEVPGGMSVIARTAALGRVQEELQWDLNYLLKLWDAIKIAAGSNVGSFLIYQESNLVVRSIRDHFSPDIAEILIDMQDIYEQAKQFMSHVMPSFVGRIKLYSDDIPLFSRFQIEHQIESAYGRMVNLPSGGSIAIDHTEALTAIDVNSAKANKGTDIEATALATNLEAAEEIARQMRLRDLGGLVVVDFIDMENLRNQREVESFFKQKLGLDRARIQMGKLSKFGLLELSRQRLQASLEESTTIPCPRCCGVGSIRGTESTAVHVLRIIQEEAVKHTNYLSALHVQLPVAVATYLLNEKREDVAKIESRMKVKIILVPNVHLDSPHYKIRKITHDSYDAAAAKLSYNLVEAPDENQLGYQTSEKKPESTRHKAMVKNFTSNHPAPIIMGASIVGRLVGKITQLFKSSFGTKKYEPEITEKLAHPPRSTERQHATSHKTSAKNLNKPRPVGVNRSNNKVQTVRPTNGTSKFNQPTKLNGSDTADKAQQVMAAPANAKSASTTKSAINQTERTPQKTNEKISQAQAKLQAVAQMEETGTSIKLAETQASVKHVNAHTAAAINQAWQPAKANTAAVITNSKTETQIKPHESASAKITTTSPIDAEVKVAVTEANSPVTKAQPVLTEVKSAEAKFNAAVTETKAMGTKIHIEPARETKSVERENTITHAVDLGSLQLVATNSDLLNVPQPEITGASAIKRYNDIIIEEKPVTEHLNYELVETKVN